MIQDIYDRVPTLPNRWLVTHEDGTTEYVTVARADEPTVLGTSFNGAVFRNLQGDLYTGIQYNTPTYSGTAMVLDLPLTSYESGKIINIISPTTFSSYPTLNVNGLGAKTVNALLTLNQKYTLIYNGSSFDVMISEGNNKYYPITKNTSTINITNENIIPQTGWTETGTNQYASENGIKLSATSTYSSSVVTKAVDGNTNTGWAPDATSGTYTIEFPQPIRINKMKTFISTTSSGGTFSCSISASLDGTTWHTLASLSEKQTELTEVTFNNTAEYKFYKIYCYTTSSGTRPIIREIKISDYTAYLFTADYSLTSTNDKFQINVIPNTDTLNIGKNYLLLSGLGVAKEIEGKLTRNELATLIYIGTKFVKTTDITPSGFIQSLNANLSFKQGTVSNGAIIPQTPGFNHYLYFVSVNSVGSAVRYSYSGTGTFFPYDSLDIDCEVNQETRVVTCQSKVAESSNSGGTANYLEIAWN